jgi:hypothetical protein
MSTTKAAVAIVLWFATVLSVSVVTLILALVKPTLAFPLMGFMVGAGLTVVLLGAAVRWGTEGMVAESTDRVQALDSRLDEKEHAVEHDQ